jgi:hypothetical protein
LHKSPPRYLTLTKEIACKGALGGQPDRLGWLLQLSEMAF